MDDSADSAWMLAGCYVSPGIAESMLQMVDTAPMFVCHDTLCLRLLGLMTPTAARLPALPGRLAPVWLP
jgi:hypothetical protein